MQFDETPVEDRKVTMAPAEGLRSVMVLGGDAVVGQALKLLLGSEDRSVSFLGEDYWEEPRVLEGVELLVLTPGLSARRRRRILTSIGDTPLVDRIPVLELAANARPSSAESGRFIAPWPCRTEELNRYVEAAFSFRSAWAKPEITNQGNENGM